MLSDKATCRQQLFCKYVEEEKEERCDICDNCKRTRMPTHEATDMTTEARDLITCLQQMMLIKARVKLDELAMTFMGSKSKGIIDSKFNTCGLYGKGKTKFETNVKLTRFVEHLIYQSILRENFLSLREGHYNVYLSCDKAFEVMSGRLPVVHQS